MTTATTSALKLTKAEREALRDLVFRLIAQEDADLTNHAYQMPGHGRWPTERELDMRDWGIAYGLAAGLLAAQRPLADPNERNAAAAAIAVEAYGRWGGEITPRKNLAQLIDAVIASRENNNPGVQHDAIVELKEAWGSPEPDEGDE
jgi:hypothetical protein